MRTRHTTNAEWAKVYRAYGIARGDPRYVIDHRVPLELGGADVPANMWPEPRAGQRNAADKDRLERALRKAVCVWHRVPLAAAQETFLGNWWLGYARLSWSQRHR